MKTGRILSLAVAGMALWAGLAMAQTCTPVTVDTWANPADDGKGPTEIFHLHRNSTNTDWYGTILPSDPNGNHINAAAGTYAYSVEFGADSQGYTVLRSGYGGCGLSSWTAIQYVGLSVKDLNTGSTTNFPNASYSGSCSGFACKFDFTNGGYNVTLVSGHDYVFYAGIESQVPGIGANGGVATSGNWTYSLRVNVQ